MSSAISILQTVKRFVRCLAIKETKVAYLGKIDRLAVLVEAVISMLLVEDAA